MAAPDHTARIRPSFPVDGTLTSLPDRLRLASAAMPMQRCLTSRDGITQVADTLSHLLTDSEAYLRAQRLGWPTEPSRWPFTSVYADGLGAAIHYLRQYAGMLSREPE